jgi:hypothetical protein
MEILKPVFVILIAGAILWIIARFLVDLCSVDGVLLQLCDTDLVG